MKRLLTALIMAISLSFMSSAQTMRSHTISQGETLYSIAKRYGVSVESIKEANPNINNLFVPGVKINIPTPAKAKKATAKQQTRENAASEQTAITETVSESDNLFQFCSYGIAYWAPFKTGKGHYGLEGKVFADRRQGFGGYFQIGCNYGLAPSLEAANGEKISNSGVMFRFGPAYAAMIAPKAYVSLPVMLGMTYADTEFNVTSQGKISSKLHSNFGFTIAPEIGFRYEKAVMNAAIEISYYPYKFKFEGIESKENKKVYIGFKLGIGLKL